MKLDKKIEITDYVTLIALVLTLVAAVFAFYFKNQQTELLKIQRQKDLLEIAKANENSELARKESEAAKRDAAKAFENAASSNEKAAKAELKSKELELELLKLRLAVSDRYLPDFVKIQLTKKLKRYSSKKVLIICNISNNAEPMNFSLELSNFLKSIGWTVEIRNSNNVMIPAPTGIKILASGKSNLEIAELIRDELITINYQCEIIKSTVVNETIIIQVNSK
jgi:ribosome-binding ATPase YchF (GTP1/OBG family)